MNRRILIGALALLSFAGPAAGTAWAGGNDESGPTVGDCISDGLYGNEPNMEDGSPGGPAEQEPGSQAGNVVPSQSPGPSTNNPNDPDNPTPGNSVGDYHQQFGGGVVPAACRALTGG